MTEPDEKADPAAVDAPPREWLRGILEPCLLALLVDGEAYGYDLAGRLEEAGLGSVAGGTLYPALLRLEKQRLLRSSWRAGEGGPGRKYYRLTAAGRKAVVGHAERWQVFASSVGAVLDTRVAS